MRRQEEHCAQMVPQAALPGPASCTIERLAEPAAAERRALFPRGRSQTGLEAEVVRSRAVAPARVR